MQVHCPPGNRVENFRRTTCAPNPLVTCSKIKSFTVSPPFESLPAGSIGRMFYDAKVYFNTVDLFAWTVIVVVISVLSVLKEVPDGTEIWLNELAEKIVQRIAGEE